MFAAKTWVQVRSVAADVAWPSSQAANASPALAAIMLDLPCDRCRVTQVVEAERY